jgi:hypothetical protein
MKRVKMMSFFAAGILAALLAGCFNPITVVPPKQEDPNIAPFTVDIQIGKDTEKSRSVAGPDADRIKGDIRNIVQLIVVNNAGEIVAFDEVRRQKDTDEIAELRLESIPFGQMYHFLLLMGHWNRDYEAEAAANNGNYAYTLDPPTLLAAGMKDYFVTGSGKVMVTMWPIVTDTTFTSGQRTVEPTVSAGKPGAVNLLPLDWNVSWTIKRGLTGNGLTDLVRAQNVTGNAGNALQLKSTPQAMVREGTGDGSWSDTTLNGNIITWPLTAYTSGLLRIGTAGSVNFRLEYVPFNKTAGEKNPWNTFNTKSVFDLRENKEPVWIIRNGVNDLAQNTDTDFSNLGKNKTANGNGAVSFGVAAKTPADGGSLGIRNGAFKGPANSKTPEITFTTYGYTGTAEVHYAVVPEEKDPPGYSDYTLLNSREAGDQQERIEIPEAGGNYDVYVILFKDGEISNAIVIGTRKGDNNVDWIWGNDSYLKLYVKSGGSDSNTGTTREDPLATVQKALEKLTAVYTSTPNKWPGKGTGSESYGAIIILDTVMVKNQITVNGTKGYPRIILADDTETPNGTLKAMASIEMPGTRRYLLKLEQGANVTLVGGLTLEGTGELSNDITGVGIESYSTFTMFGGVISKNYVKSYSGGGVVVYPTSWFTMNGGKIADNSSTGSHGGGVYNSGIFMMNDGEISNNSTVLYNGGGVYNDGIFTMTGGKISDNSAGTSGGGVSIAIGMFTMSGGKISDNSAKHVGGGVLVNGGIFAMNDGAISHNSTDASGGGVAVINATFTMSAGVISGNTSKFSGGGVYLVPVSVMEKTGGTIYGYDSAAPNDSNSNKVTGLSVIPADKGHAIYLNDGTGIYRKETTVGSTDKLSYKNGVYIGW